MVTVTKSDLIALGYGPSFAADIIREAKKLMVEKGHTYYQSRKLDRSSKRGRRRNCSVSNFQMSSNDTLLAEM